MRFAFGKNWKDFISFLDEEKIEQAESSLKTMLSRDDLKEKSFLDVGSGSGLFSLAAAKLGATVSSFDYDTNSVECTNSLKSKFNFNDHTWKVTQGDVLDKQFLATYSKHDIVYSWGVLHHTGKMWEAIENAANLVDDSGLLFIAIYNDQGWKSKVWTAIKQTYNFLPSPLATMFSLLLLGVVRTVGFTKHLILLNHQAYIKSRSDVTRRGMNAFIDWKDWVGGYPFEVATPGEIKSYLSEKNFTLRKISTTHTSGCNEFVFEKRARSTSTTGKRQHELQSSEISTTQLRT